MGFPLRRSVFVGNEYPGRIDDASGSTRASFLPLKWNLLSHRVENGGVLRIPWIMPMEQLQR